MHVSHDSCNLLQNTVPNIHQIHFYLSSDATIADGGCEGEHMNTDKPDIGIIYGKGSFKDSELEALGIFAVSSVTLPP